MRLSPTWAEMATTGVLLVVASAVPRRRLMAPGPRVAEHTPRAAGKAAEDLGHERCRLLVADQDVADGRPDQGVGEVDVLLAGDAEHARDALVLEAAHEQVRDASLVLGHPAVPRAGAGAHYDNVGVGRSLQVASLRTELGFATGRR